MYHEYKDRAVCESCLEAFSYDSFSNYEAIVKCNACRNDTEECRDYDEDWDAEFHPHSEGKSWSSTSTDEFQF